MLPPVPHALPEPADAGALSKGNTEPPQASNLPKWVDISETTSEKRRKKKTKAQVCAQIYTIMCADGETVRVRVRVLTSDELKIRFEARLVQHQVCIPTHGKHFALQDAVVLVQDEGVLKALNAAFVDLEKMKRTTGKKEKIK